MPLMQRHRPKAKCGARCEIRMKDYTNSEITHVINEHVHSKRDRQILLACFVDGITHENIAEAVDLSPRRVSKIISDYSIILERHLSS